MSNINEQLIEDISLGCPNCSSGYYNGYCFNCGYFEDTSIEVGYCFPEETQSKSEKLQSQIKNSVEGVTSNEKVIFEENNNGVTFKIFNSFLDKSGNVKKILIINSEGKEIILEIISYSIKEVDNNNGNRGEETCKIKSINDLKIKKEFQKSSQLIKTFLFNFHNR